MTALIDTLFQIEKYLGLELDSLMPFAEQDDIGGFHPDPTQRKWDMGAIFDVEGRTLYAVIRALKPEVIVEIGSGTGCSSTHMAAALLSVSQYHHITGHITTIDRGNTPHIPDDLKDFVTAQPGDGISYLALQPDNSIDFLLEDADHTTELCHAIGELAKTKLKPGGVLFVHDIEHFAVGAAIRAGYDLAGMDVRRYRTDPSDCGWGVWQRPPLPYNVVGDFIKQNNLDVIGEQLTQMYEDMHTKPAIDTTVLQAQEDYPIVNPGSPAWNGDDDPALAEPPVQKVKRTRKPKAKPTK